MGSEKRLLIVDDEVFIRMLLLQALEELEDVGVELLSASNGREGVAVAQQERPNLIFLDVMMPYINGYEACRLIKESNPDAYVILLTAKGQALDKVEGEEAGADEFITKPFDPDYILNRSAEILGVSLDF